MKRFTGLLLVLVVTVLFVGCGNASSVEPTDKVENLLYKIEHENYQHPVNPYGPVTTDIGYRYEVANGATIYIKNHTELDFWFEYDLGNCTWTLEQVGRGGSIYENTNTLKTNYNEIGEYTLDIERGDTIFRVRILVD